MKTLEERKTEKQRRKIYQKYVYRGDTKINEMKKKKKKKIMINCKEGFLKNSNLHISKQQHNQTNKYH